MIPGIVEHSNVENQDHTVTQEDNMQINTGATKEDLGHWEGISQLGRDRVSPTGGRSGQTTADPGLGPGRRDQRTVRIHQKRGARRRGRRYRGLSTTCDRLTESGRRHHLARYP